MAVEVADLTLARESNNVANRGRWAWNYFRSSRRTILLVHGFNTSESGCLTSLEAFRHFLADLYSPLRDDVYTTTWAGAAAVGAPAYPWIIGRACESGQTLYNTICTWYGSPGTPELVLVAHSLGCRLVLEMLAKMKARGRPTGLKRLIIILMAAAVPTQLLDVGGKLDKSTLAADEVYILHSEKDQVLSVLIFGVGETLAGEGLFPQAMGRRGEPKSVIGIRKDMAPFGHNDYWKSRATAELICSLLDIPISALARQKPITTRGILPFGRDIPSQPVQLLLPLSIL